MKKDHWLLSAAAVASCLITMTSGASPTGGGAGDAVCVAALTISTAWCAGWAPWQLVAAIGVVSIGIAPGVAVVLLGSAGTVAALAIGWLRIEWRWARATSWGLVLGALLRSELDSFFGLRFFGMTALITAGCCAVVVSSCLRYQSERGQRALRWCAGIAATFVVVALGLSGWKSWLAVKDLRDGREALSRAQTAIEASDGNATSIALSDAAKAFSRADGNLHSPFATPASFVPVLAQHVRLLADISAAAVDATTQAATASRAVDIDTIGVRNGTVDIEALRTLALPARQVSASLSDLTATVEDVSSPWLVPPAQDQRRDIADRLADVRRQAERLSAGIDVAPSMLGADGPRTFFVAFLNPAEARGIGGFMGNWAVVRANNGALSVVKSGRTIDLFWPAGSQARPKLQMSEEFFTRYSRFGAQQRDGRAALDYWANSGLSPDLGTFATLVEQMLPSTTVGTRVDGVITVDVEGLAGLMRLSGPIQVPLTDQQLTADTVVPFLLTGQYALFPVAQTERAEVLGFIADSATSSLLTADLPGPRVVADAIGPAISAGHIQMWSMRSADQTALRTLNVSGELIEPEPGQDSLAVVVNNAGGNKLDAYLTRSMRYDVKVDADGRATSTLSMTLTNTTPSGLPAYVSSNARGLPEGTNVAYVSIYSAYELQGFTLDGVNAPTERERELGHNVYSTTLVIPRGASVTLFATLRGDVSSEAYSLRLHGPFAGQLVVDSPQGTLDDELNLASRTTRLIDLS